MALVQPNGSTDLWSKALLKLHPDDKKHVLTFQTDHKRVLQDVLKEAEAKRDAAVTKMWKITKTDGSIIVLRDVFEKVIQNVTKYAKAVDIAVNVDPLHAGVPWAIVRALLQTSMSDIQAFGCLSEGIEVVAGVLSRYAMIEKHYIPPTSVVQLDGSANLGQCIVSIYTTILTYLAKASRYWSCNTVKRMAKSIFKDTESENCALQLAVSKADNDISQFISIIQHQGLVNEFDKTRKQLNDIRVPLQRIDQSNSKIQDNLTRDERREIFQWLSTIPCEAHHQEAYKKFLKGTGIWLLERREFKDWQKQTSNDFAIFWLHGIPGSGKSKLTSLIIQTLLDQNGAVSTRPPLAYFYCSKKSGDPRTSNPKDILLALLRQLTGGDSSLPLRGSVAREYRRRKDEAKDLGAQISRLDFDEIVKHILDITIDHPITIVIDALDEADDPERGELCDALEQIAKESQRRVRIFISSRNDGDIVDRFGKYLNIGIEEKSNHDDIRNFVEYKTNQAIDTKTLLRGKVSSKLRDEIVDTLSSKAQGMFRWVELSIETLSNSRRLSVEKDVRSELGKLPAKLEQQYAVIYTDIQESAQSTASIAKRVFAWMLAAQRVLTVEELIAAVALDDDGFYHEELDASRVLDICRNLIMETSIDNDSTKKTFRVAHLSVKEFLGGLPEFSFERIHSVAVARCLENFKLGISVDLGLLRHYTVYLFEHAELSELSRSNSPMANKMTVFLFDHQYKPAATFQEWSCLFGELHDNSVLHPDNQDRSLLEKRVYNGNRQPINCVCAFGLSSVLNNLIGVGAFPWKTRSSELNSILLFNAVFRRKCAVARILLENGIFEANDVSYVLRSAVENEDKEMIDLLLKHGGDPLGETRSDYQYTPLWSAVMRGNLTIFKRLIDKIESGQEGVSEKRNAASFDWNVETLFEALRIGNDEISGFMIERGADIYKLSPLHDTTLQVAVRSSRLAVIKSLLEKSLGTSPEKTKALSGSTNGYSKAHQAYLNAVDDRGRTALHCLVTRERSMLAEGEAIFNMLVECGADTTAITNEGVTAVHVAAFVGSTNMMRCLVGKGSDINAVTNRGTTALHFAAGGSLSSFSIIRYLTENGLDPLARDQEGNSALHYAVAGLNLPALEALLKILLDVNDLTCLKTTEMAQSSIDNENHYTQSRKQKPMEEYINIVNKREKSLLHVIGNFDRIILFRDSSYEFLDEEGETDLNMIRFLVDLGANINQITKMGRTPLSLMAEYGYSPRVEKLLAQGADVNLPDHEGKTPLHYTANTGCDQTVELLIKHGANVDATDNNLCTPLHSACQFHRSEVMRLLLLANCNFEARDDVDATPLHHHAAWGFSRHVLMLIKMGANVHSMDRAGASPLHWAATFGNFITADILRRYGANPEAIDHSGATPIQYAAESASGINESSRSKIESHYGYERTFSNRPPQRAWLEMVKASEKWCEENNVIPHTSLKRSQSLPTFRIDQPWGDFSEVEVQELSRM